MIKGVIFDMDGVLADNRDAHIEAFRIFCNNHGVELDNEKFLRVFGQSNHEIIPEILPQEILDKCDMHDLSEEKEAIYRDVYAKTIQPHTGLVDFLEQLKAAGIKCAVGSSGDTKNVDFVLGNCRIGDYFDAIANGDMVTKCKPDPEVFLLAVKKLGLDPKECVVIEDSNPGIAAGKAAGCKVVAMATTQTREALEALGNKTVVSDFTELSPEMLMSLP